MQQQQLANHHQSDCADRLPLSPFPCQTKSHQFFPDPALSLSTASRCCRRVRSGPAQHHGRQRLLITSETVCELILRPMLSSLLWSYSGLQFACSSRSQLQQLGELFITGNAAVTCFLWHIHINRNQQHQPAGPKNPMVTSSPCIAKENRSRFVRYRELRICIERPYLVNVMHQQQIQFAQCEFGNSDLQNTDKANPGRTKHVCKAKGRYCKFSHRCCRIEQ